MSVYLELFHGRQDPAQGMDDWGTDGPVLGPFEWVHTTYANDVKCGRNGEAALWLEIKEGMVHYKGVYYGDWSVFDDATLNSSPDLKRRRQQIT